MLAVMVDGPLHLVAPEAMIEKTPHRIQERGLARVIWAYKRGQRTQLDFNGLKASEILNVDVWNDHTVSLDDISGWSRDYARKSVPMKGDSQH